MNYHRIIFSALFLYSCIILTTACTNSEASESVPDFVQQIDVKNIQDTSVILLSDFCTKVEYVPLELSQSSCVGGLSCFSITGDGDYIVFDKNVNASVYRFDSSGKFLNIIGRVGRQESEHSSTIDAIYDKYRNQVIIWDQKFLKIKYYSIDGEYLYGDDIDWGLGTFTVLDSDRFLVYQDVSQYGQRRYDFKFFIISRDTYRVEKEISDPDAEFQSQKALSAPDIFTVNDTVFFKNVFMNSLYKISDDDEIVPCYYVSYEKPLSKPSKKCKNDYRRYVAKMIRSKSEFSICDKLFVSSKNYFVYSICKGLCNFSVIERNGLKRTMSGVSVMNNMVGEKIIEGKRLPCFSGVPYYVSDSLCYFVLNPSSYTSLPGKQERFDYLASNISDPEERNCAVRQWDLFYSMLENDNPVLLKCTLK